MNPDLYKSTSWSYPELDDPLMQDAMQLNQKSSNWYYTNNWEDKGSTSFMSTEPTFGLQFSKNIENPTGQSVFITKPFDSDFIPYLPIQGDNFQLLKVNPKYRGAGLDNLRYLHSRYPGEGYNIVGNDFNELYAVNPINKDVQAALIDPHKEDLINYLKSAEYARRLKRAGLLNKRDEIVQKQIDRINNTEYTMAPTRTVAGLTKPTHQGGNNVIVFSTGATDIPNENVSLAQLYAHEGGHTKEIKETAYANANLIKDWKK
jgi:hypothetical protein